MCGYLQKKENLKQLFNSKIQANFDESQNVSSFSINLWNNPTVIWMNCFQSESSALDTYHCSICGTYTIPISTLCVNHNIIKEDGFNALQKALFLLKVKLFQCHKKNVLGRCSRQRTYNNQIFIELDIRENINQTLQPTITFSFCMMIMMNKQ